MTSPDEARGRLRAQLLVTAGLVAIVAAIPPARRVFIRGLSLLATGQLAQFQLYLRSLGSWAPAVSIVLMVAEALLVPVPATIIMVSNGLVFGAWKGALVSFAGALCGSIAAYVLGRSLGRTIVERVVLPGGLSKADRLMARYGGWAIVIGHWIPGIPGDPVSYAAGITRLPVAWFLLLTVAAQIPATLATAFVGQAIAGDVPLAYWLTGWILVIGAYAIWRIARAAPGAAERTRVRRRMPES